MKRAALALPLLGVLLGVLFLPAGEIDGGTAPILIGGASYLVAALAVAALAGAMALPGKSRTAGLLFCAGSVLLGVVLLMAIRQGMTFDGPAGASWLLLIAVVAYLWRGLSTLAAFGDRLSAILVPVLFGGLLLYFWEVLTLGFEVPKILLPAPSAVAEIFSASLYTLWIDFEQTFIRSVIPGYIAGCSIGFLTAIAIDRSPFLQRGLLPIGSMVSAMPIVGIAPIMVMWFGFGWESKAAVIVVMTFFPMMVNTLAGLQATGRTERDLMRSYAASYPQTLWKVRLPAAMPFVFNALKLNSTLALIGAIVAEFFGTPIFGMGFRISSEVARLNVGMVWATIAVAAAAGSLTYGALVLVERATTFWHPSYRKQEG
ncbi:ABC transporter permease [Inquilinus sp. CAU 1745]|uniref:ABC transporter permease n=1 Tax=Inquilinus sp. CAU 1745 TaxID=3140369 RepID=UPI00325AC04F